jgi:branched-chain amino acid transport system permease protein
MALSILNTLIQGVMLGGLYALFALGLSMSVGIMRTVNIAHGDLIVLTSFMLLTIMTHLGVNVFVALALIVPFIFAAYYLLQRYLLQRVAGKTILAPLLVTFGLSVIIQNGLLESYGAYPKLLDGGGLQAATLALGPFNIGLLPLLTLGAAIGLIFLLDLLLYRSPVGANIRAVADDVAAAKLVGLPSTHIYAIAMGIVGITIAVAASFMGLRMNFDATSGPSQLLVSFEVVVLGGLGSLWGTLLGGIVIGVAQSLGGQINFSWQILAGHLAFLIFFMIRPQGLFPKY